MLEDAENVQFNGVKYRLKSFCVHQGDIQGGHYTAVARIGEKIYHCDDQNVVEIEEEQLKELSRRAYIFFYEQ